MRREKLKAAALFTAVFAFFAGAIFVSTGALKAANPSGIHVTVYQTNLLSSIVGPDMPVFTGDGQPVDIVNNPNQAFGDGSVREGTYKRIHFVVGNKISFTGPNPDPAGLCSGLSATVNSTFLIDQNKSATDKVDLYFATADDGGSSGWTANGSAATPFLIQNPVDVKANATTIVKLIFKTAGTLICSAADTATLTPPSIKTINYVQKSPSAGAACNGEYWFTHYHISSSQPVDGKGNPILQPTLMQILERSGVVSGWGTLTINPPDGIGNGTWSITDTKYEDALHPGMAEHRHSLAHLCTTESWCDDGYYDPAPFDPPGATLTGTYTVSGGQMIFNMGGGSILGGMSGDCSTFVGVDLDVRNNDLVFAVKKPSGLGSKLPADTIFVSLGPGMNVQYDTAAPSPFPALDFGFDPGWGVVSTNTITNAQQIEWNSRFDGFLHSTGTATVWSSLGPSEHTLFSTFDIGSMSVGPTGLVTGPPADGFIGMGASGSAIQAGGVVSGPTPTYDNYQPHHHVNAGFLLNAAKTVSLSDLTGRWIVAAIEGRVSDIDGTWGNDNEQPAFGLSYVKATIDGSTGTVCRDAVFKDTFTGAMTYESTTCSSIMLKHECYACNAAATTCLPVSTPQASCIVPGTSTPGIYIPVFYVGDGAVDMKLALDSTKTTIVLWKPNDVSGTPAGCTPSAGSPCTNAVVKGVAGVGVKVE